MLDSVRLILPLRVIEEVDAKKYTSSSKIAQRARAVLSWLDVVLREGPAATTLNNSTTIEAMIDSGPRRRLPDADGEILDACAELAQMTDRSVTIVTGDTALRLRAQAARLRAVKVPGQVLMVL